jgi:hypothetical protein
MDSDQFAILKSYFSSNIDTESETGWEESTLAALQHLIKNSLGGAQSQVSQTTKM